ncbi:PepSY-associated TM helix domain-containing protein [Reyranella sp.]|uniref:PepSY-associated TM helix domain-containing protein n=1 Tax=Reyranella sp. TaxID=1929291 RepID=UPI0025F293E9|nr:PepSY-associated TM helix domain-containing protein [Reyranella sp.]
MNWLHTWAGIVFGSVLFTVFWMGTLSVFDREIDRWMMPQTRLPHVEAKSMDAVADALRSLVSGASQWFVFLPTPREPMLRLVYRTKAGGAIARNIDPETLRILPEEGSWGGTRFIYPFHYSLHLKSWSLGIWLVGAAGVAMLVLCVSGVVVHRKLFTDFFTVRRHSKQRRLLLDLHNVAGVLGLPFHCAITLSGLIIFFMLYFPTAWQAAYGGNVAAFASEGFGIFAQPRAGEPAASMPIDAMMREASQRWGGAAPSFVRVWHPGDRNSYVEVRQTNLDGVPQRLDVAYFDAVTGVLLSESETKPVMAVQRFIAGLHFIQFHHWILRWIYFGLGLTGCLLIATGFLFWLETRRRKHVELGFRGVTIVEGFTVGSVTGIVIATLSFFVANRMLPPGVDFLGHDRAALEIWSFYLVWLMSFVHAWLRPGRAWVEQCSIIAALAVVAVLLNWITTGDHLFRALGQRHLWPIAGMDLMLLTSAAIAGVSAGRLRTNAGRAGAMR